ncbi:MAG TPA: aldo/keto reductase [Terriglobales bacterium]|jgi:aryl-alcohol dehydrogenase-like predicted oxidoreductase|nr:aldo/keto reductase [Terriglobales bacterium]
MKYRQLGRTGLEVSEIGYGAWGIGQSEWMGADDEVSLKSLKAARDAGVNFFDTALAYGMGHSEQLLARAFGKSNDVIIASKVPPKNFIWPAQPGAPLRDVFPKEYVLSSLDHTLKNLGRDTVDLYQFHVWSDEWAGNKEWLSIVREIRGSGKARFVGISINDHQPANSLKVLATGLIDTVQVIYNIFDQSPEDELFPYCHKHHIGVLARVPFDEGSLTGKIHPDTTFPEGDFRHQYFGGDRKQQVWERVQRLTRDAAIPLEQLPQFALRFCLSQAAVSTVIPGMRTPAHVASNAAASDAGPLSSPVLAKIRPHRWVRNFYD